MDRRKMVKAAVLALASTLAGLPAEAQQRPSRESFMFSYADRDGDGELSPAEFGLILYPATPRRVLRGLSPSDLPEFLAADRDGSGGVSLEEFSGWFSAHGGKRR